MTTTALGVSKEHITKTPGVCGGKACIDGTRIRVLDVVYLHESGLKPDEIATHFVRPVSIADVCAALAYYHDNRSEIQTLMDEDTAEEEYGRLNPSPLTIRLREIQQREASGVPADPLPVG